MSQQAGIYAITHIGSGRRYIGSSNCIVRRWYGHRRDLKRGNHRNTLLQRWWNKDGASEFRFEVLEVVDDVETLHLREQAHLDHHQPLTFNRGPIARAPWLGVKRGPMSQEWRDKIAAANIGRKLGPLTSEHRANLCASLRGRPRPNWKPQSDEARAKMSASHKARYDRMTPEQREQRRIAMSLWLKKTPEVTL